jgi:hypothetical protein
MFFGGGQTSSFLGRSCVVLAVSADKAEVLLWENWQAGAVAARRFILISLLACATWARAALADDPVLEVRARMHIRLDRVSRTHRGLVVTGALLDESTGEAMPARVVAMRLAYTPDAAGDTFFYGHAAPTDDDGGFRFEVPNVERTRYWLHLSAPGDSVYSAPLPTERMIDLARRAVDLQVHAPSEHPITAPALPLVIEAVSLDHATSGEQYAEHEDDLPVQIEIDGQAVATVILKKGRAQASIAVPSKLVVGRELVVRASFAGDDARGAAEGVARVRLVEPVVVELAAEQSVVAAGERVHLTGRVVLGRAQAQGLPVVIRRIAGPDDAEAPPSVTARTSADGSFRASLPAPHTAGRTGFEADLPASDARARGLLPAASDVVVVEVRASLTAALVERRPAGLAIAVGAAACIALMALALVRRFRRRRLPMAKTQAGFATAPRKLFATLRLASDRRVRGRVRDADRNLPLAGVQLRLAGNGVEHRVQSGLKGEFAFPDVEGLSGAVVLHAELAGHLAFEIEGTFPHRGEWAALELRLAPLRAELMRRYDAALAPYLREGERLGRRTPKELHDAALKAPSAPRRAPLAALRHLVEDRCFGKRGVDSDALQEAERLAQRLDGPAPPA